MTVLTETACALAGALVTLLLVLLVRLLTPAARVDRLAADLARDGAELRLTVESRLAAFAEGNAAQIGGLADHLARRLDQSVTDHLTSVQHAAGALQASADRIADLRRLFGSVRARGAWGERQLRALLDDILPAGAYDTDCRLREGSAETVEFAVRMPSPGLPASCQPRLAIDAKFPTEAYDRLLAAEEQGDVAAARIARRGLEQALRTEAKRIAGKYICPPATVDYAILYLPTDGLYIEASRLPGLLDELGRVQRVLVMGPAILPGLLRTIQLGAMTLALGQRAEKIARQLGATRHDLRQLDETYDKLARHVSATTGVIDELRRRTRAVAARLDEDSITVR